MTDEDIISEILEREGGWVDRDDDHGGPTMRGITLATYRSAFGAGATAAELRGLTEQGARAIYRKLYVHDPGYEAIGDDVLRALVVDTGVHSGQKNATKMLQRALGIVADGAFGPRTRAAVEAADPDALFDRLLAERMEFLGRLVTKDLRDEDRDGIPDNAENAWGWSRRLGGILRARAAQRRAA